MIDGLEILGGKTGGNVPRKEKRAVIYLRVSTREQTERDGDPEGYSLPAQREACLRKAESLGATVVDEFPDRGESAKTADRPELQRLLTFITDEPVDFVIVHKVDRLARNRADDVAINLALQRAGVQLVSVTENIDETPSGVLLHGIMSSIAEFYSRNLANEVMKGTLQKVKAGGTPSRAPIGYRNVPLREDSSEVRTVVVDPERGPLVAWAFEAYATGEWTMLALLDELTDRGLRTLPGPHTPSKPLSSSQLHRMLHNPYYTGVVRYQGVVYHGSHQPLISRETWQRVQDVLVAKSLSREKERKHHHYLKGSVFCGACGSRLIVTHARSRRNVVYAYFSCLGRHTKRNDCTQQAVYIEEAEDWVADLYDDIALTPAEARQAEELLLGELRARQEETNKERSTQERRLLSLRNEQRKLLEAHYADAIPLDLLKSEQVRIGREVVAAERRLAAIDQGVELVVSNLQLALSLLTDCGSVYRQASPHVRRLFNQAFFKAIYIGDEGLVGHELAEPFGLLVGDELRQVVAMGEQANLSDQVDQALRREGQHPNRRGKKDPDPWSCSRGRGLNKSYVVGEGGFEPPTSCTQSTCATRLRYSPEPAAAAGRRPSVGRFSAHPGPAGPAGPRWPRRPRRWPPRT